MELRLPAMDPAAGYPMLQQLRTTLRSGDWPAGRKILDDAEPAGRTAMIQEVGRTVGIEPMLRGALVQDPADGAAAAVLGSVLIKRAWEIRTSYQARHVSRRQFEAFHAKLRQAEEVLYPAAVRQPADPAIRVLRLTTARGLQLGIDEAHRRYGRLAEIDPQHLPGQLQLLQQLCPKWSGSLTAVWAFVGEVVGNAPLGAHNHVLVVEAYIEQATDDDMTGARRVLSSPQVQAAIREAAERSIWHPDFRRTHGWVEVLNAFAMAFSVGGDLRSAKRVFQDLGNLGTEYPWAYLGAHPASTIWIHRLRTGLVRGA